MSLRALAPRIGAITLAFASLCSCSHDCRGAREVPTRTLASEGAAPKSRSADDRGVVVHLEGLGEPARVVSFGVPVPKGITTEIADIGVEARGAPIEAGVKELLDVHDAEGRRIGVRAFLVQLPGSVLAAGPVDVTIRWHARHPLRPRSPSAIVPFDSPDVSTDAPAVVETADRTIRMEGGAAKLVETARAKKTLFMGREARVLATFPPGYVAATGLLGELVPRAALADPKWAGLAFLSDALRSFGVSSMYDEGYALNPSRESVPDPIADYSGWLYDRCATYLVAWAHWGDVRFLRQAHRTCSFYARSVRLDGPGAGHFELTGAPDAKYSHLRGLYAYYALTGDESALAAGKAIAQMWYDDPYFVKPYAAGHVRGHDKVWTERLLATSLEGLYYGHRLTGERRYLDAFRAILATAYRHITGDAAALAVINPGARFPPQNCFVHSGTQQADAEDDDPWCSPWMSALAVDPLLRYEEQTGDARVDAIFVRLARFLRDVGTSYATNTLANDSFLSPTVCDDPAAGSNRRELVPLYGVGIRADGKRATFGEDTDALHCADVSALTAAAIRALSRHPELAGPAVGPFASERDSFVALHEELADCARRTFEEQTRPRRDPRVWTARELAKGVGDPRKFIDDARIGFPSHANMPERRLSWWFNASMLQYGLLDQAGVAFPTLAPPRIQPKTCPSARASR